MIKKLSMDCFKKSVSLFILLLLPFILHSQLTVQVNSTAATCPTNGTIKVDIGGGNPQYCYQLVGIANTLTCIGSQTYTFQNLGPGNYTVRVSDNSNPPIVKDITVNVASQYEAPNISAVVNLCNIVATATKGKAPYEYSISSDGGVTWGPWQSSNFFPVSSIGDFKVRVQDACGSISPFNIKVDAPFNIRQIACMGTTLDSIKIRVDLSGTFNDVVTKVVYGPNDTLDLGKIGTSTFLNKCNYKLIIENSCGFKVETSNPCKPLPDKIDFDCLQLIPDTINFKMAFKPSEFKYTPSSLATMVAINGNDVVSANADGSFLLPYKCDGWKVVLEKPSCNFKIEKIVDSCAMVLNSICNNCGKGESTLEVKGGKAPYKFYYNIGLGDVANPNGINNPIFKWIPFQCAPKNILFKVVDDCGKSKSINVGCFNPLLQYDCKNKTLVFTGKYGSVPPPIVNNYPNFHVECITCVPKKFIDVNSIGQLSDILPTDSILMYDNCKDSITIKLADPNTMFINESKSTRCSVYNFDLLDSRPYKNCNINAFFTNFKYQILDKNNVAVDTINYNQKWDNFISGETYTVKVIDQGVCGTPTLNIVPTSSRNKFSNIKVATTSILDSSTNKCNFLYKLGYTGSSVGIVRYNANGKNDTFTRFDVFLTPGKYKLLGDCDYRDTNFTLKPLQYPKVNIIQPSCPNGDKICLNGLYKKTNWNAIDTLTPMPISNSGDDNYTFDCRFNTSNCPFRNNICVTGLQKDQTHTIYIYPSYEGQAADKFCPVDSITFKVEPNYTKMTNLNVNFFACTGGSGITTLEVIGGTKPYIAIVKDAQCNVTIRKDSTKTNLFTISSLQTGQYCFEVTDSCGNTVKFDNIKVDPSIFNVKFDSSCKKDLVNINASKLPGATYTWTNTTTGAVVTPTVDPWNIGVKPNSTTNTIYRLEVKYVGCTIIDTTFTVPPSVDFTIQTASKIEKCMLRLSGNVTGGIQPITSNWYDKSNPNVAVDSTKLVDFGSYIFRVKDARGCVIDTTINQPRPAFSVTTDPKDTIDIVPGLDKIVNVVINGGKPNFDYKWDITKGFKNLIDSTKGIVTFLVDSTYRTTTYTVTVIDSNGCKETAKVTLRYAEPYSVKSPTAFTPNGDGKNDYFQPVIKNATILTLKIYSRWGQLVYEGYNLNEKSPNNLFWDGLFDGKEAPSDVYVYVLSYTNMSATEKPTLVNETFTLLR